MAQNLEETLESNVKENSKEENNYWVPLTPEKVKSAGNSLKTIDNNRTTTQKSLCCDLNLGFPADTTYDCGFCGSASTSDVAATATANTTMIEGQNAPPRWSDDLDFGGLSCLEILDMAEGASAIGANQYECRQNPCISINQEATPCGKEKKADARTKKRKVDLNLNQKPEQKRQKYYWAKIADSNKHTPKTPTPKTPKPIRKKNEKKLKNDISCKRVLNFDNNEISNFEEHKVKEVSIITENRNEVKEVDQRSSEFICLNEIRKMGPNFFGDEKKKKRKMRVKKTNVEVKQCEILDDNCVIKDFIDLVKMMKGETRNLLPTKPDISQDSFKCAYGCVLSLLSSSKNIKRKKRSNSLAKKYQYSVPEQCKLEGVRENKKSPKSDTATSKYRTKERKTKVVKEKKSGCPYQRKKKQNDYLNGLHDWCDESLEQIMDQFICDFESLQLYDDPKKLKSWSIIVSPQNESKLMAERIIMKERALRFILTMRIFQGRKDFVEWKGSVLDSVVGVFLTQNVSDVLSSNAYMNLASKYPIISPIKQAGGSSDSLDEEKIHNSSQGSSVDPIIELPKDEDEDEDEDEKHRELSYSKALNDMLASLPDLSINKEKDKKLIDWEAIRVQFADKNHQRIHDTKDSVDWEAVRKAPVNDIAKFIEKRGQHRIIAEKIQKTLNRLFDDHGTLDLEWLRKAPSKVAKAYLLSFYGLGLKSVECLRLLTLKDHGGFPVDVNIKRAAVRLGWVPLKELPVGLSFHVLEKYPLENDVQQYLLPRLSDLTQEQRYELHYQMITFGKVFCSKKNPNCRACPFKGECEYYKSQVDSVKQNKPLLSWKKDGKLVISRRIVNKKKKIPNPFEIKKQPPQQLLLLDPQNNSSSNRSDTVIHSTTIPIVQEPDDDDHDDDDDDHDHDVKEEDIEDIGKSIVKKPQEVEKRMDLLADILKKFVDDGGSNDINEQGQYPEVKNVVSDLSKALVCADASIPLPKHINPTRLRTEHQVYELPYDHPLLKDMERQVGEMPYLLAIFPQGVDNNCDRAEEASSSENERTVPGIILIPIRTALRGFFPLNGTYFQVNEVFVDHETSKRPINVPTKLIWNLPKRTLYCGSGASSIYRGLSGKDIIKCNWSGFICTRAFSRQTREPKKLPFIFHKGNRKQGDDEDSD